MYQITFFKFFVSLSGWTDFDETYWQITDIISSHLGCFFVTFHPNDVAGSTNTIDKDETDTLSSRDNDIAFTTTVPMFLTDGEVGFDNTCRKTYITC